MDGQQELLTKDAPRADAPVDLPAKPHARLENAGAGFFARAVLYPGPYTWFVFAAALDIMLTTLILLIGGWEVNVLAEWIIEVGGLPGIVFYKFALVVFVVFVCEVVGRRKPHLGRRLAEWAVAISFIPVVVAALQLLVDVGWLIILLAGG